MKDFSKHKINIENEKRILADTNQASNPMSEKKENNLVLTSYSQSLPRQRYDEDIAKIAEVVRILNNLAPLRMPEYNFNLNEINGEHYYKPDGTLLLIREYDSDIVRDYYANLDSSDNDYTVSRILEHDKLTGRLRTKIEPIKRKGSRLKTNITIFDLKVNNKYTIIQLSEGGIVNNVSEFSGKEKSFQTLYRNIYNFKPARYMEGKDTKDSGFEMIDCIFGSDGNIARIKKYSNKKETCIDYTNNTKNVSHKTK